MLSGDRLCDATCLDFDAGDARSRIPDQQGKAHGSGEAHLARVQSSSDGRSGKSTRMEEEEWKMKQKEKKTKQSGQTQGRRRWKDQPWEGARHSIDHFITAT